MPNIIRGNPEGINYADIPADGYSYEYPNGLDLKPDSDLHNFIKNKILQNARVSSTTTSNNFDEWNKVDEKMTAFIPADIKEEEIRSADRRKPISIVFPYSFVIAESILSYLVAAFFSEPMFRYEGVSPEDKIGAIMLENVIQNHCNRNKVALNLHTMFKDDIWYGFGVCNPLWTVKHGHKVVKKNLGFYNLIGKYVSKGFEKDLEETVLYEGNSLQNIDPYHYLPDPNVAVQDIQSGEFSGWVEETNYLALAEAERYDEDIFNVKYVRHVKNKRTSIYSYDQSKRMERIGGRQKDTAELNPVDVIWMYMNIIPNTFGPMNGAKIGDSEYPEKWLFGLASDDIVIKASPMNLTHNDYPVAIIASNFDGYSPVASSKLAIEFGLQEILDWLLNSHVTNVRKAINDMIIVDPYSVNINDLKNPQAGALIRLRRPAWGRGVKDVAQQLVVNDITRFNISDAGFIMSMMDKVGGANNPMQGDLRSGGPERLTKGEFQGTMAGAINRMERMARVIGLMGMQDIGYLFAHHCQQMMSEEVYVKTTGRWQEVILSEYGSRVKDNRMKVTPWDILIDYDLQIRDGSVPGGNFSDVWVQLYQILASNPELAQHFEMVRIFKHIARSIGAKDVEQFERTVPVQPTAMPDEQVERETEKGNVIPLEGAL